MEVRFWGDVVLFFLLKTLKKKSNHLTHHPGITVIFIFPQSKKGDFEL